jgi:hypothetical protein
VSLWQVELDRTVSAACAKQKLSLVDFTVSPRMSLAQPSAAEHVYYVECESLPGQSIDASALAQTIDGQLAAGNEDYRVHRGAARSLASPRVELLARGTFTRWMRVRGKLGGQHKIPRVIEDPQLAAALVACSRAGSIPEPNSYA